MKIKVLHINIYIQIYLSAIIIPTLSPIPIQTSSKLLL